MVASCYPLHPLAAAVLPELCSRHGQHERTLFSFLTGPDPASAASFPRSDQAAGGGARCRCSGSTPSTTTSSPAARSPLPRPGRAGGPRSATRIRDTHGLPDRQAQLAKAIAVLNLVSTSGTVRASRPVLALTNDPIDQSLAELETTGIVTYRDFADEYRIWHGTDVDIRRLLDTAHQTVHRQPLADILSGGQPAPTGGGSTTQRRTRRPPNVLTPLCRRLRSRRTP